MLARFAFGVVLVASIVRGAELRGKVTNVVGGEPLARIQVKVLGTNLQAITSSDGTFAIKDIHGGNYTLRFEAVGFRLVTVPVSVSATDLKELEISLAPDNFRRTDSVVVTADVFHGSDPPSVSQMILTSSELKEASTVLADDPFRAIQSLPGVSPAGNNELYAEFIVMGAPFSTIGIYLDDVLIPSPFHAIPNQLNGASLSLLTSETVQEMKLFPVAYPEKFGDLTGAALDIRTRDGSNTKPMFRIAPVIADSEFLGEGGIGKSGKGSWLTSLRKSYIGWIVRDRVGPDFSDISFYDGDAKLTYNITPHQNLNLYVLAGHTNVEVAQPSLPGDLRQGATDFYFARLGWRWTMNRHLLLDNRLAFIRDPFSEMFLDGTQLRGSDKEWSGGSNVAWNWNTDNVLEGGWTVRHESNGGPGRSLGDGYLQHSSSLFGHQLYFSGGLRFDDTQRSRVQPFSPQASVSFRAGSTQFDVGYGRYVTLSPAFAANIAPYGCPYSAQNWTSSDHATAGIEQRPRMRTPCFVFCACWRQLGSSVKPRPDAFALTPAGELLKSDHPQSMRDTVVFLADPLHFNIAAELLHSVRTGQPTIQHLKGKPVFEYFASDAVEFERFHRAMTNLSAIAVSAALEAYDFSFCEKIVDVGGGHGFAICSILQKCPQMKGILFDLKDIVPGADQRIRDLNLQNRCRTAHGDFFKAVPEGGDAYFMKHILHDWTDEQATTILRNIRKALGDNRSGKVVLLEFVVPEGNEPHPSKLIDIEMLFFPGGRERMEHEWRNLFAGAGFRLTRIVPTRSPFCVIEADVA